MTVRSAVIVTLAGVLTLSGCGSPRMTDTARTGIERLLLSTAAERAVAKMDVSALGGKKVFLDASAFEGSEKAYAVGTVRDHLGLKGAMLVDDKAKAEVIVEARAGTLDTDSSNFLIGVPAIPIMIGRNGFQTPELAIVKKAKQWGTAKIALTARSTADGRQLLSTGPRHGEVYFTRWTLFIWFVFERTDEPQAKKISY